MNHPAFRLPLNAVSVLGAAGAPSARRGIRCPGPAATHAGERQPLLQGLRKAIPLNPHGGPGRGGKDDTFKSRPRKAAEQTSRPGSAARGQHREGLGAPSPSRTPRMREMPAERSAGLRTCPALLPRRAGPGCLQVPADFTPHPSLAAFQMPFFRCQNQKSSRGVGSEWRGEAKPEQAGFKLCACYQPPELDAGTGGTSHPELPEGLPASEVGPQRVLQASFH